VTPRELTAESVTVLEEGFGVFDRQHLSISHVLAAYLRMPKIQRRQLHA
jgi:hypothetical protein